MSDESALVSGEWAERHLDTPGVIFIETGNENTQYLKGHIPGAVWVGWDEIQDDLRLGIVGPAKFAELMSAKGVGNSDTIVLYSATANLLAAFMFWCFKLYGHERVKLLDGGRDGWELNARPLSQTIRRRETTNYRVGEQNPSVRATRDDVLAAIGTENFVDVRTPEEYSGKTFAPGFAGEAFAPGNNPHEVAQRSGHVPGAVNIPWDTSLRADGTFRSAEELAEIFGGVTQQSGVITYCWVGARSAHTWFVLRELLGRRDARNYDGSWAEYGSMVGVPVERDEPRR